MKYLILLTAMFIYDLMRHTDPKLMAFDLFITLILTHIMIRLIEAKKGRKQHAEIH